MQIITLSLYRFDSLASKLWAFSQMGFARPAVKRLPDLQFAKMMGTGGGAGFSTRPNLSVYTILCSWPSMEIAQQRMRDAKVFAKYRDHAADSATLFLTPTSCRGAWDGAPPFNIPADVTQTTPVVALTRASLRKRHLRRFWSRVPAISDRAEGDAERYFMVGMGEVPWLHQVTFSLWKNEAAMREFSLNSATHGEAVKRAYTEGWFSEYMFARFNLLDMIGEWPGLDDQLIAADS